tara:strand:+ start:2007 stop:2579 length:573 start_codon:yes stop_codon:yes gene_type:complete
MWVAGVDEAGRGPLAGPVVSAAVILDSSLRLPTLADSKKLSASRREELFSEIQQKSIAIGIGQANPREIDELNILHATLLSMKRAIEDLVVTPDRILCDGNYVPEVDIPISAIIKGDSKIPCISAASIIAKVTRDRIMHDLHLLYPYYGFDRHKGYPTRRHRSALKRYGPITEHRRTFSPVRDCLSQCSE